MKNMNLKFINYYSYTYREKEREREREIHSLKGGSTDARRSTGHDGHDEAWTKKQKKCRSFLWVNKLGEPRLNIVVINMLMKAFFIFTQLSFIQLTLGCSPNSGSGES